MIFEVFMDKDRVGTAETLQTPSRQRRLVFTYDREWLASPKAFPISPEMPLSSGPHEPFTARHTPFAFDDAAPDRWGRNLIDAQRRRDARASGQRWQPLDEVGLLLSVNDETRQGALRFRIDDTFVAEPARKAEVKDIAELRRAAVKFEESGEIDESVEHLIGVGSSPGGAAPKAWVHDDDDQCGWRSSLTPQTLETYQHGSSLPSTCSVKQELRSQPPRSSASTSSSKSS